MRTSTRSAAGHLIVSRADGVFPGAYWREDILPVADLHEFAKQYKQELAIAATEQTARRGPPEAGPHIAVFHIYVVPDGSEELSIDFDDCTCTVVDGVIEEANNV